MPTVTLWQRDSLRVTVSGGVDGLTFHAQDLDPPPMFGDEYEYAFSIAAKTSPSSYRPSADQHHPRYWNSSRQAPSLLSPTVSSPGWRPMTSRSLASGAGSSGEGPTRVSGGNPGHRPGPQGWGSVIGRAAVRRRRRTWSPIALTLRRSSTQRRPRERMGPSGGHGALEC